MIPLFKSEERKIISNYRPVSTLPVFSKISENSIWLKFGQKVLDPIGFWPGIFLWCLLTWFLRNRHHTAGHCEREISGAFQTIFRWNSVVHSEFIKNINCTLVINNSFFDHSLIIKRKMENYILQSFENVSVRHGFWKTLLPVSVLIMKVLLPEVLHTGQYKTWPEEREKFKFFLEEAKILGFFL